ncbi:cytochrome P450 [Aspergillus neoniger CBS 115656]|uniref:Cytochrome P450 n=1 Tax=Aspergillus neoniger (strain CBS 115656) TaxID=1448310 RepID=A0A318YTT1_ASPNB|nr:cytochrome P450 [Aspergillus neoniger CBS 115656]PYH31308.1 cytochrome P450 [Aspergillus neoniger CBS 115656]
MMFKPFTGVGEAGNVGIVLLVGFILLILTRALYLGVFHPLARYPGPLLARFSNLYSAYHAWKGDIHIDIYRCHERYGDHVRYAPNRLLINTAGAVQDIYGHRAPVKKYVNYRVLAQQAPNTLTMQDKIQHSRRRRVLSQGFSARSLESWQPRIVSQPDRLSQSSKVDRLTFDTMTSVSFDSDFDTLRSSKYRYVIEAISASNIRLSVLLQAQELATGNLDGRLFPSSIAGRRQFVQFIRELLGTRLRALDKGGDLFAFLQQCKDPATGEGLGVTELSTETATFIIAGSDTSSTTMAAVCHYVTGSSECHRRVTDEVRSAFASLTDIRLGPALNSCVFLRGCVDEALRLSPPAASALWREVEDGGASIDGHWLPPGCEVGVGIYSIHHRVTEWPEPFQFNPDRWLKGSGTQEVDGRAYMPFSIGARSCIGKPLALAQVMLTMARLFWEFDMRRVDRNDSEAKDIEYVVADHVTAGGQGPMLSFRPRIWHAPAYYCLCR